jgi:anti-sigma B factor antagonist
MSDVTMDVREAAPGVSVVAIKGEITSGSEPALMEAFARAAGEDTRAVLLDFSGLEYMNSGGIGLLVTMLVRARRQQQRLLALGLSEHYREIFSLTRLDEAITVADNEQDALAALSG